MEDERSPQRDLQCRNDGVAAASSDGAPTGGRGPATVGAPDSSRVLSD